MTKYDGHFILNYPKQRQTYVHLFNLAVKRTSIRQEAVRPSDMITHPTDPICFSKVVCKCFNMPNLTKEFPTDLQNISAQIFFKLVLC